MRVFWQINKAPHSFSSFFPQRHDDNFNSGCLKILPSKGEPNTHTPKPLMDMTSTPFTSLSRDIYSTLILRLIALFSSNYNIPGVLSPSTSTVNVSSRTSRSYGSISGMRSGSFQRSNSASNLHIPGTTPPATLYGRVWVPTKYLSRRTVSWKWWTVKSLIICQLQEVIVGDVQARKASRFQYSGPLPSVNPLTRLTTS